MMEHHGHISILERFFGKMSDKQRTKMQNKILAMLLRGALWVLVCFGIALIITDDMLASSWQWAMGLF